MITIWSLISGFGNIRHYFVENGGQIITVNSERNVRMLRDFFFRPKLTEFVQNIDEEDSGEVWFKHDDATIRDYQQNWYESFSRVGNINRPAGFPDPASCGYFLGG